MKILEYLVETNGPGTHLVSERLWCSKHNKKELIICRARVYSSLFFSSKPACTAIHIIVSIAPAVSGTRRGRSQAKITSHTTNIEQQAPNRNACLFKLLVVGIYVYLEGSCMKNKRKHRCINLHSSKSRETANDVKATKFMRILVTRQYVVLISREANIMSRGVPRYCLLSGWDASLW